jgi:diguanylate cyclase (GGDEF)-like protein/PAS domain S-box-containing protein
MFRNLMKQTSDAVFVVDPEEGRFLDVNDRACKNMGYDRKELLNMGVMDIKTDVPEDFLWEKLIREVKKEGFKVFESMHVRKDGTKFPVEVNVVYVNQGKREFMVAMARDITLRKKVEKAVMSAVLKAEDESAKSEAIIASMGDGISIHDIDYKIMYQNQILKDVFGDHKGEYCYTVYEDSDGVCEGCPVAMCYQDGEVHRSVRKVLVNNKTAYYENTASPLRNAKGDIIGAVEVGRDVTEHMEADRVLKESEEKYRNLAETITEVVYRADPETFHVNYVNKAVNMLFGYTPQEWVENQGLWWNTIHPDDKTRVFSILKDAQGRLNNLDLEYRIIKKDKTVRWVEDRITWQKDPKGKVVSINGLVYDITERKRKEDKFSQLAGTDPLTGAFNRTKFDEIIIMEMERAKRFHHPLSFAMMDIDHFKQINDTHGHIVGDSVLKAISELIKKSIRKTDYLIRWGGEEFMIISPETILESAKLVAERTRKAMEHQGFDKVGKVTGSFGVTEFRQVDGVDDIIKRADDALYKAKSKGRNRVEISD